MLLLVVCLVCSMYNIVVIESVLTDSVDLHDSSLDLDVKSWVPVLHRQLSSPGMLKVDIVVRLTLFGEM